MVRDENHLVLTPYPFAGHEILQVRLWAQPDSLPITALSGAEAWISGGDGVRHRPQAHH
jgi:hypothetical protein